MTQEKSREDLQTEFLLAVAKGKKAFAFIEDTGYAFYGFTSDAELIVYLIQRIYAGRGDNPSCQALLAAIFRDDNINKPEENASKVAKVLELVKETPEIDNKKKETADNKETEQVK